MVCKLQNNSWGRMRAGRGREMLEGQVRPGRASSSSQRSLQLAPLTGFAEAQPPGLRLLGLPSPALWLWQYSPPGFCKVLGS